MSANPYSTLDAHYAGAKPRYWRITNTAIVQDMKDTLYYDIALNQALHASPNVLYALLSHYKTSEAIIKEKKSALKECNTPEKAIQRLSKIDWAMVASERLWHENQNGQIITLNDPRYPKPLTEIKAKPYLLYAQGDPDILSQPQLAIVGSRNPSPLGLEHAKRFAVKLADAGWVITSGMALGIDGQAHKAMLNHQRPTIAVLGSGLKHIYPKRHTRLFNSIIEQGVVISEFPLDTSPAAMHFPRRNRIISGLSHGTLVIQASLKSGSLITANIATAQGRDVFAIPGSIDDPLSRGGHHLIKQGAKLVESVEDILEELPQLPTIKKTEMKTLDPTESHLLECLGFGLSNFDQIIRRSGLSVRNASSMLLKLELHGYIKSHSGGYRRTKK